MTKTIAIVGKNGSLASALINSKLLQVHQVQSYSKLEYNFTNQQQVENLAQQIASNDTIVVTTGVYNNPDPWDTYLINTVGIALLLKTLIYQGSSAHIIVAGSHGGMWTTWPNMPIERIWYNNSKRALTDLVTSLSHSKVSESKYTMINFSKFESSINNYTGYQIDTATQIVIDTINNPTPPLVLEMESP